MRSSRNGPTSPHRTPTPRTSARCRADADHQTNPGPEATTRHRLAAEALRWACHAASLVVGPSGPSPLARRALRGLKKRLSKGAAETAVRVTLDALTAAGRESAERPSYLKGRPYFCPYEKALGALDFSLRAGFGSLAIPSKLVGVREHQDAIRRLKASGARFGTTLRFVDEGDRIAVAAPGGPAPVGPARDGAAREGALLGYIQTKHEVWVRALIARSTADASDDRSSADRWSTEEPEAPRLGVCLLAVTGDGKDGRLHGVNVAFVRVPV